MHNNYLVLNLKLRINRNKSQKMKHLEELLIKLNKAVHDSLKCGEKERAEKYSKIRWEVKIKIAELKDLKEINGK